MSLTTAQDIRVNIEMDTYTVRGSLIAVTGVAYVVRDETTGEMEACWKTGVKHISVL